MKNYVYFTDDNIALTTAELYDHYVFAKENSEEFPYSDFNSWLSNALDCWLSEEPNDSSIALLNIAKEFRDFSDEYDHQYYEEIPTLSDIAKLIVNDADSLIDWLYDFTFYDAKIAETAANLTAKITEISSWL